MRPCWISRYSVDEAVYIQAIARINYCVELLLPLYNSLSLSDPDASTSVRAYPQGYIMHASHLKYYCRPGRCGGICRSSASPCPHCDGTPSASVWPSPRQTPWRWPGVCGPEVRADEYKACFRSNISRLASAGPRQF